MIKDLRKYCIELEQKITCILGKKYTETTWEDTHNSGGLDKVIREYCPITGKFIKIDGIYISEEAKRLILRDVNSF